MGQHVGVTTVGRRVRSCGRRGCEGVVRRHGRRLVWRGRGRGAVGEHVCREGNVAEVCGQDKDPCGSLLAEVLLRKLLRAYYL